ncbi:hypothetical protein [Candidatus Binatus sp.]|uniref:hypothetical protein n=1 Tax=Candidatus Binatus sp. TaxID=2811406 RepID=UPI00272A67F3|nr:hypothetical protein [Candidatus Binatus sp.]
MFNLTSRTFGPLILTLFDVDSFALNFSDNVALFSSDLVTPQLLAVNVPKADVCSIIDKNVENLNADPDGIAVDPTTNIWVAGNFESPLASVINFNGSTFTGSGTLTCTLTEAGTPPNSINHDTGTGASGMAGVAINPRTHQALVTAVDGNQIALLSLPKKTLTQITAADVSSVSATIPPDPEGTDFNAAEFPYGVVIDSCQNRGYVLDDSRSFLAQVDLKTLQKHPEVIGTALPAGTCAGVSTSFQCDNGNGVRFYPLPGASSSSSIPLPAQFSDEPYKRRKSAKYRN